jgi:hypothetical protein
MRRLGLEEQLIHVRRHLGVAGSFLVGAAIGAVLTGVGMKEMMEHSGFGPYLSLIRSDFGFVATHRMIYVSVLSESAPAALIAASLFLLTILLVCIRLVVVYGGRLRSLVQSINKS